MLDIFLSIYQTIYVAFAPNFKLEGSQVFFCLRYLEHLEL